MTMTSQNGASGTGLEKVSGPPATTMGVSGPRSAASGGQAVGLVERAVDRLVAERRHRGPVRRRVDQRDPERRLLAQRALLIGEKGAVAHDRPPCANRGQAANSTRKSGARYEAAQEVG